MLIRPFFCASMRNVVVRSVILTNLRNFGQGGSVAKATRFTFFYIKRYLVYPKVSTFQVSVAFVTFANWTSCNLSHSLIFRQYKISPTHCRQLISQRNLLLIWKPKENYLLCAFYSCFCHSCSRKSIEVTYVEVCIAN